MKLIVTIGNAHDQTEELVFDLPEPISWLGVEIEDHRDPEERSTTGRMTIIRIPFYAHGEIIHSLCGKDSVQEELESACPPIMGCKDGVHHPGCKNAPDPGKGMWETSDLVGGETDGDITNTGTETTVPQ